MTELIPPDLNKCQVMIPSNYSFMTLGGKPGTLVQCNEDPSYIVYETIKGKDGLQGSMSMCIRCKNIFIIQMGINLYKYRFAELVSPPINQDETE